jgi:hypothetical protein
MAHIRGFAYGPSPHVSTIAIVLTTQLGDLVAGFEEVPAQDLPQRVAELSGQLGYRFPDGEVNVRYPSLESGPHLNLHGATPWEAVKWRLKQLYLDQGWGAGLVWTELLG